MAQQPIHIAQPNLGPDVEQLVLETLRSGMLAQGAQVAHLEDQFRSVTETKHAVALSSGTAALIAALQSFDFEPGDEVITTPFTFVATLNAILRAGLTARFADIGPDFNLDPEKVAPLINAKTRAILPVHLYGLPADMDPLMDLARSHDLRVIEDAAQAVGASYRGRPAGSFDVACFSLYATKNITTGEGGMVTTNDDDIADRLRLMRNQGMRGRYEYVSIGENMRLTDVQAAMGIPQMDRLEEITAKRRANAMGLAAALAGLPGLELPLEPPDRVHAYHQFTVRITDEAPTTRDELAAALASTGIGSGVFYPAVVWDYDIFRSNPLVSTSDDVSNARTAAREVLSLPVHPRIGPAEIDAIGSTITAAFANR